MNTSEVPDGKSSTGVSIPRWLALVLAPFAWFIAIPFAHGVAPWAISLLTPRSGWTAGRPGVCNLSGLIPVVVGTVGLIWIFVLGFAHAAEMPERIELNWSPKLLLTRGPYAYTRNPMYVAEQALWFGWAIFFGSVAILIEPRRSSPLIGIVKRRSRC